MNFAITVPDENPSATVAGPKINPGLIVANSNLSCSGKLFKKSQADLSASVLDLL